MHNSNLAISKEQKGCFATVKVQDTQKGYLATIHILKNKLGLSDETYRALLQESYQVTSSKDLNISQQKELIYLLNSQFISTQQKNTCSYAQANYILFLAKDKISNLSAFCSKIIKRTINNIQELSKSEAIKIINALKRYEKKIQ